MKRSTRVSNEIGKVNLRRFPEISRRYIFFPGDLKVKIKSYRRRWKRINIGDE